MVGYSGTPLWKKLGYKAGISVYINGAPEQYVALLDLPADVKVTWLATPKSEMAFVHIFATAASRLKIKLKSYRESIASDGVIWA